MKYITQYVYKFPNPCKDFHPLNESLDVVQAFKSHGAAESFMKENNLKGYYYKAVVTSG